LKQRGSAGGAENVGTETKRGEKNEKRMKKKKRREEELNSSSLSQTYHLFHCSCSW